MFLCYYYQRTASGSVEPMLAIVADKPDNLSVPVPVENLIVTNCALIRISAQEALKVSQDPKGGVLCSPLTPGRLYLTPDLHDKPGIHVKAVKITKDGRGDFMVSFRQEKDGPEDWRIWKPNEAQG